ncbi:MAG: YciI family protein [Kofleriaceae bacterium]|nr:YciI family protein [Kofleriaceae bacterium]
MQYLLLIYENERLNDDLSPEQLGNVLQEYGAFTEAIKASGHLRGGEALEPTAKATTVRVRDGKTLTTDGPFAETREQLGGYYLVEAADLDEAIKLAARIPGARVGSIEIRPVMVFDQGA